MKLAVSNIGWDPSQRSEVLSRLPSHGIEGIVIAPIMVFPEGPNADAKSVSEFKKEVEDQGLDVVGLQSLTFDLKEASLFGPKVERQNLIEHLKCQAELAGSLGATSLIFGSPGLRQNLVQPPSQVVEVFTAVADEAHNNNTKLCIEPLSGYGNRFIQTTMQGVELTRIINHPGFGLHLDSAAITGAGDGLDVIGIANRSVGITSFDASAPDLLPISEDETVDHRGFARELQAIGYTGYVSLEMRQPQVPGAVDKFFYEVDYMNEQYAG